MIILCTATGAENLGDELITLFELQTLHTQYPHDDILLYSHDPARTRRFLRSQRSDESYLLVKNYFPHNIRKSPFKNIILCLNWLASFMRARHIYVGGGGLLYSTREEGHSPLRLWWMRALWAQICRTPLTYLSLGVSAEKETLRKYARGLFTHATITVRDIRSQERVKELGYTATLLPDPVMSHDFPPRVRDEGKTGKIIGFALRKGFVVDSIIDTTIRQLIRDGYRVILLPHSLHPTDREAHDGYYMERFLSPGVETTQSIEATLRAYETCDLVITMRLHSIILAHRLDIPSLTLSYSEKTDAFLESIGQTPLTISTLTGASLYGEIREIIS